MNGYDLASPNDRGHRLRVGKIKRSVSLFTSPFFEITHLPGFLFGRSCSLGMQYQCE